MQEYIKNRVHELYWNDDINCARTTIICLFHRSDTTRFVEQVLQGNDLSEKERFHPESKTEQAVTLKKSVPESKCALRTAV